jgi:hypothetical protein
MTTHRRTGIAGRALRRLGGRPTAREMVAWFALVVTVGGGGVAYAAVNGPSVDCDAVTSSVNPDGTVSIPLQCRVTGLPPATPVPTVSATQTPAPSQSPTATQTPTVAPTATTAGPTVPPASPTPTASSTTPAGCMAVPSACGWPDASNTGTTGPLTVVSGNVTLSTPGMVYANRDVRGCIRVTAANVTIRNVRVTCSSWYAVSVVAGTGSDPWVAPNANLLIEDSEINLAGQLEGKGIAFAGYTARRVHFYGGSDCAHANANVVIADSFCEIPAGGPADGPHYDGFQSDGGSNLTFRHNTIRVPYSQTSAILMSTNTSPIRNVSIVDNLVAGGGYTIYCGTDSGGDVPGLTFTGNVISRTYFARGGYWGPVTGGLLGCPASGWRWDGQSGG